MVHCIEANREVKHAIQNIFKKESFKYRGLLTQGSEDINEHPSHWVRLDEWRLGFGDLYDKNILPKLKGELYKMVVRSSLFYRVACWPVKNSHV